MSCIHSIFQSIIMKLNRQTTESYSLKQFDDSNISHSFKRMIVLFFTVITKENHLELPYHCFQLSRLMTYEQFIYQKLKRINCSTDLYCFSLTFATHKKPFSEKNENHTFMINKL